MVTTLRLRSPLLFASLAFGALIASACLPADHAIPSGAAQFAIDASRGGLEGVDTLDGWKVSFERVTLSYKTVTLGKVGEDRCSYRGRGELSNLVFDPRRGIVQSFNGIEPSDCPDVGVVLGPPDDATTLGPGVDVTDLIDLTVAPAAHAVVSFVGRSLPSPPSFEQGAMPGREVRVRLRFDTLRTSSAFGGCAAERRGVRIEAGKRDDASISFAPEELLRERHDPRAPLRFGIFADMSVDDSEIVTMEMLDARDLAGLASFGDRYRRLDGSFRGSVGDYVRERFRGVFLYDAFGRCTGNDPLDR